MSSTDDLIANPDDALRAIIVDVQAQALQTQSEAYTYLTDNEHPDVAPGDVLEVRCAPQPAVTVSTGAAMPPAQEAWAGYVATAEGALYRCYGEPGPDTAGEPDVNTVAAVADDPSQSIEGVDGGYRIVTFSWVPISPSWADRALSTEPDCRLRNFPGMAGEQAGTVTIHPDMAIGLNRPVEN